MRKLIIGATLVLALIAASSATAAGWAVPAGTTNTVVSPPVAGGGYPDPPGASKPVPGTCGVRQFNSNHSESWLAVQPGTESIIGTSKFFTSKYSTFYNFYVGSYTIQASSLAATNQVQGYECTTVGTQAMPPSWTNSTDPNVDFDTKGRAYQTMLPFNAYWAGGLHPNSAIDVSYTDDLGRHWMKGNGGQDLEASPNQNSVTLGHVEDKQWIAVNHIVGNVNADHVYAMWTIFNGSGPSKIMVAVSRDRGQTFSKAVQLTSPSATTPANTYIYPSVGSDGTVYAAFVSGYDTTNKNRVGSVYVTWSKDDGVTWAPFVKAATPVENPNGSFANTLFRDGIIESFTASPTYPGHAYLTYENWDPAAGTSDVYFTQTIDGGATWSSPTLVNDDAATGTTDQFQPSIAAGSGRRGRGRVLRQACGLPEGFVDPARSTVARRIPASTCRCRPMSTAERARFPLGRTSAAPRTAGTPTSRGRLSMDSASCRVPPIPTLARRAAGSSGTTSVSRSPMATSTR